MSKRIALALLAVCHSAPALAHTREGWHAPVLTNTRYDEHWSDLADKEKRADHWTGSFKFIPLSDDVWVTTGIELRARQEGFDNNIWGESDAPDDSYLWLRALPYADLHAPHFRAFVQPIVAHALGVAPAAGPIDQTGIDLLQGFADVSIGPVTVRVGRQMISLGTERLIGTRYGPNVPLAFDGVRAIARTGKAEFSVFAVKPVIPALGNFNDSNSSTKALWGVYATVPRLDFYYLGYRNRVARFDGVLGREERHTLGARYFGRSAGWHWNVECLTQFGHFTNKNILAWSTAFEVGHAVTGLPVPADATLRFNIVSGDTREKDNTLGTFNAMFPKGKYFGELSPIGPANIINLNPRLSAQLTPTVSASLAGSAYWRFTAADGIYDIPGRLIRPASDSHARYIGTEAEVVLNWQATPELSLSASAALFSAGTHIKETGPAKPIRFVGTEANFRF